MSGLEELGIPGPVSVREVLSSDETLAALEEFQFSNGILLPSLQPALPLLDLHEVRRLEFHQSVLDELKEKMISRIKEIGTGNDKNKVRLLNELLAKSIPVINVKLLRPVVMTLMQHIPKIKPEFLSIICRNKELYKEAAVEVKQQIWEGNQSLFGDEVSPLLSSYIDLKEESLLNPENRGPSFPLPDTMTEVSTGGGEATLNAAHPSFFQGVPKQRRQFFCVQELARMIGKNVRLYEMTLQFLRTLFLRTGNVHYCTLRAELLMAQHDREAMDILSVDPCHKFTWCLDACIRDKCVDPKRAKELCGFLDTMRSSHEQVLGDLSMVLCDPHSIQTIANSIIKILQSCLANETLPRANDDIVILARMLSMGLRSWHMIDSRSFKEPKVNIDLIVRIMPCITSLMVDDSIALMSAKSLEVIQLDPISDYLLSTLVHDQVCTTIFLQYCFTVLRNQTSNAASITRIFNALPGCHADTLFADVTLHDLISCLCGNTIIESFLNADFCTQVFDGFFVPNINQRDNLPRHLIRLIWWVHSKISSTLLDSLLALLQPIVDSSIVIKKSFDKLTERLKSYQLQQKQLQEQQLLQRQASLTDATGALLSSSTSDTSINLNMDIPGINSNPYLNLATPSHVTMTPMHNFISSPIYNTLMQ